MRIGAAVCVRVPNRAFSPLCLCSDKKNAPSGNRKRRKEKKCEAHNHSIHVPKKQASTSGTKGGVDAEVEIESSTLITNAVWEKKIPEKRQEDLSAKAEWTGEPKEEGQEMVSKEAW